MSSDSFPGDPGDRTGGEPGRYVGAMMRVVWQRIRDQIYAGVVASGYDDLHAAHVGLFRYPSLDGLRPSQLADQVGITKQSVNDLLGHLERHGYLMRVRDSDDGRARVIRLTSKGRQFEQTMNAEARAAQLRIAEKLGPRHFAHLQRSLELLTEST